MAYSPADYADVIEKVRDWYGVSSEQAWQTINAYNLTPAQFYEILPKEYIGQGADGLYHMYFNNGTSAGVYQQASVPLSNGNVAESIMDSNVQTGVAATTEKVRFAGNSVIDEHGNIKTSAGVTKYNNGTAAGKILGVAGSVVSSLAAAATGISLGKKFDAALYNANPAFWDSIGASTLNPETWNSITMDMADTGVEGALKTAFNFILGLNPDGSTQAYMPADAYNYMAYALARAGMFDSGESEATAPTGYTMRTACPRSFPVGGPGVYEIYAPYYTNEPLIRYVITSGIVVCVAEPARGSTTSTYGSLRLFVFTDTAQTVGTSTYYDQNGVVKRTYTLSTGGSQTSPGGKRYARLLEGGRRTTPNDGSYMSFVSVTGDFVVTSDFYNYDVPAVVIDGTTTTSPSIDGVDNQTGATQLSGVSATSTPQQVADAIAQQYPGLYNNRIEQDVVSEDGTTKTLVYYPVPLPNQVANTTINEPTTITPDTPVTVILPAGQTITLPNGTTITGDGKTPYTLPGGTYVLPSNTVITNNYYVNETLPEGGTQVDPTATSSSTNTLLQTIINILTNPQPQTATQTSTTTPTTNPPNTGSGATPPLVVPVGSASALWAVYNPSLAELNQFGGWLWSNNFVDQLLKMFNDPMQAIIGLHKTFIPPITGTRQNIIVGYLDSGVSCLTVPTQYSTVDCGTVDCSEYFGNVFDYAPYTKVYIYLPFIGFRELDVSQVMRSRINVTYHGDAFTGACLAEVSITRDAGAGGVLYTFSGDCAARYPLSHGSYMGIANAIAGLTLGIAGVATGTPVMGAMGALSMAQHARASVEHSGGFTGNSGAMGIKKPYLVILRPQTAMADNYQHYTGQPANHTITLGNATGYVRVKEVHVEDIVTATDAERTMIETALKEGVLI